MDKKNNKTECEPCKTCEPTQVELEPCEANRNRECGCETGKFHHPGYLYCEDCIKCAVGEGVEFPCTQTSNTKCQPCPQVCILPIILPFPWGGGGGGGGAAADPPATDIM